MSDQNEEFQAEAGQPNGSGSLPTPRPTVRERSRRFFVRLPTDVDATEGVGAQPVDWPAVDPDAATQEAAYQAWSAAESYAAPAPADAYGYPQEAYGDPATDQAPAENAGWGDYAQEPPEAVQAPLEAGPAHTLEQGVADAESVAGYPAAEAPELYQQADPTQLEEPPSEFGQRPLAEQEYIPEAYDARIYVPPEPIVADEPAGAAAPEREAASEPFPGPSQFLGSSQEAVPAQTPAWVEVAPEPDEVTLEAQAAVEAAAPADEVADVTETPFLGGPAWAAPAAPEQPAWPAVPVTEPASEPRAPAEPSAPSWSFAFAGPQAEAPEPAAEQPERPVFAQADIEQTHQLAPEPEPAFQPASPPSSPAELPVAEQPQAEQAIASAGAPAPEPTAASTWSPPAKDWSTGPSWGGSRNAEKPKPVQAPSLLEDPVAAVGLYIPGDVERFEGDMPLFGDADVMGPLWQGDGLGEPLFVDFNDLPQMLAGLRQLLPHGTRLTYNYDHERAWVRSHRDVDLAAYAESVRSLMWAGGEAGEAEQPPS